MPCNLIHRTKFFYCKSDCNNTCRRICDRSCIHHTVNSHKEWEDQDQWKQEDHLSCK